MNKLQLWSRLAVGTALCLWMSITQAAMITVTEGTYFNGSIFEDYDAIPIDARKNLGNAGDMDFSTFYALGVGGEITVDMSPQSFGEQFHVFEFTFANVRHRFPESAKVFVTGPEGKQLKGELFNSGNGGGTLTYLGPDIVVTAQGDVLRYAIHIPSGTFSISLKDTTFRNFATTYETAGRASDGFDVADLTFMSVPEPTALTSFGLLLTEIVLVSSRALRHTRPQPWMS